MISRYGIIRILRKILWFSHEFILIPALFTALVCVTVYQPWYIALLMWTILIKIDKLPCPWMELVEKLKETK